MYPWLSRGASTLGSTDSTSPTRPLAPSCQGRARTSLPSLPESPTARPPTWFRPFTICLLTRPTSTISTTSMVSASVTRRPLLKRGSIANRLSHWLISGPPPWTTTGWTPTQASKARSRNTASRRSFRTMAAPPYFTTTRSPEKRWI